MNTSFNQDIAELIKDDNRILIGKVQIYFNGKNITNHCGLLFGSGFSSKGVTLRDNRDGLVLIGLNQNNSWFSSIFCNDTKNIKFDYYFKEMQFNLKQSYSYFGGLEIFLIDKNIEDKYKSSNRKDLSIKKIRENNSIKLKKNLEDTFSLKNTQKIEIIF